MAENHSSLNLKKTVIKQIHLKSASWANCGSRMLGRMMPSYDIGDTSEYEKKLRK